MKDASKINLYCVAFMAASLVVYYFAPGLNLITLEGRIGLTFSNLINAADIPLADTGLLSIFQMVSIGLVVCILVTGLELLINQATIARIFSLIAMLIILFLVIYLFIGGYMNDLASPAWGAWFILICFAGVIFIARPVPNEKKIPFFRKEKRK